MKSTGFRCWAKGCETPAVHGCQYGKDHPLTGWWCEKHYNERKERYDKTQAMLERAAHEIGGKL